MKQTKAKSNKGKLILLLLFLFIAWTLYSIFFSSNPKVSSKEEVIIVPKGATVAILTDTLEAHHIISSTTKFKIAAKLFGLGSKLQPGTYRIAYGLSNAEIIKRLTGGEYAMILQATFPEGLPMWRVAQIAHNKLGVDSLLFIQAVRDTQFIHSLGVPREAKTADGYLFPDTYKFFFSADPKSIVEIMITRWKNVVNDSLRTRAKQLGLSTHELMTFASIIEGEAKLKTERDTIAGVYWNRIKKNMLLQADPTVQYGLGLQRPVTHDDLEKSNPYNTYLNVGLPPGPICNPGKASVLAALNPTPHEFLYFVTRKDGTGGHYFSKTLDEQTRMITQSLKNRAQLVDTN